MLTNPDQSSVSSELHSPLIKRKAKMVKQSEKENEEVPTTNTTNNTKSPRKQQRPVHNNNKNNNNNNNSKPKEASPVRAQKNRDFTVDIFTPKSSEAKNEKVEEKKEEKEVEETKKVAGSITAADKVRLSFVIVTFIVLFSGGALTLQISFWATGDFFLSNIGEDFFLFL